MNEIIQTVRDYFADCYGWVNFQAISNEFILDFLNQLHIRTKAFEVQMDLMYDNILANDLVEVQE